MQIERNTSFWLRTALVLGETGSPSRAAKQLGVSITTIYRHIDALEQAFEFAIFVRHHSGWTLRDEAAGLLSAGREIERLLVNAENDIRDAMAAERGSLRIAVSDDLALHYVAPRLAQFCAAHPRIQPELIVASTFADLVHGEADVAIRPDMDPGDTLVGQRVGSMSHAFYASKAYITQNGSPASLRDLVNHTFCGYGAALADYTAARWLADHIPTGNIAARFGTTTTMTQAVGEGIGIGLLPCFVGDSVPSTRAVLKTADTMPIDIWLVTAAAGRKRPKIRAFFKFFGAQMRTDKPLFKGRLYAE